MRRLYGWLRDLHPRRPAPGRDRPLGRQPLAAGADTPVETRLATGGQAANVAAWVAELGGRRAASRSARTTPPGSWRGAAGGARGRARRAGRRRASTGVVVSLVGEDGERTMATDRGVSRRAPAGRARGRAGSTAANGSTSPATRCSAEPIAEAALAAARLARGARGAGQRRPLVVELRSGTYGAERVPRELDAVGARRRLRERARVGDGRRRLRAGGDRGREARLARRRGADRRRGRASTRRSASRWSTRRAPATRSRPASSSAGSSSALEAAARCVGDSSGASAVR